jgi:hypothetical protein
LAIDRRTQQTPTTERKRTTPAEHSGDLDWAKLIAENRSEWTPERVQELQNQLGNRALELLLNLDEDGESELEEAVEENAATDLEAEQEEGTASAPPLRALPRMGGTTRGQSGGGVEVVKGGDDDPEPTTTAEPDPPEARRIGRAELANATLLAALTKRGLLPVTELSPVQRRAVARAEAITPDPLRSFLAPLRAALQSAEDLYRPDLSDALEIPRAAGRWARENGWSASTRGAGAILAESVGAIFHPDSAAETLLRIAALVELALFDPSDSRRILAGIASSTAPRDLASHTLAKAGPPVPTAHKLYREAVGKPAEPGQSLAISKVDERLNALRANTRPLPAPIFSTSAGVAEQQPSK